MGSSQMENEIKASRVTSLLTIQACSAVLKWMLPKEAALLAGKRRGMDGEDLPLYVKIATDNHSNLSCYTL